MSVILSILKWITFAVVGLIAMAVALLLYVMSWTPSYDDKDDPRYHELVSQLTKTRDALDEIGSARIDLSSLNAGDWTTACIFGGYNDPLEKMIKRGAKVRDEDRARLGELKKGGFRLAQVEEFEIMFAFIDLTGTAQFIHFEIGIGPGGQHLEKCITKPQTVVDLRDA